MARNHPAVRRQAGFSLLEVLVAFTVFALVLGVLLRVFGDSQRAAAMVQGYTRAVMLAESQLVEALADRPYDVRNDSGEQYGMEWQLSIERYEEDWDQNHQPSLDSYRIEVTVQWQDGARTRSYQLQTLAISSASEARKG